MPIVIEGAGVPCWMMNYVDITWLMFYLAQPLILGCLKSTYTDIMLFLLNSSQLYYGVAVAAEMKKIKSANNKSVHTKKSAKAKTARPMSWNIGWLRQRLHQRGGARRNPMRQTALGLPPGFAPRYPRGQLRHWERYEKFNVFGEK